VHSDFSSTMPVDQKYHLAETSIKKKDASSTLQIKCKHPDDFWVVCVCVLGGPWGVGGVGGGVIQILVPLLSRRYSQVLYYLCL